MPTTRRLTLVLFISAALATTGYLAAITVGALAGRELTGSTEMAGIPNAVAIIGTAIGASVMSSLSGKRGRRLGLGFGYLVASIGAAAAYISIGASSFFLLVAGAFVLGFGQSATNLSRYAAGDMAAPGRKAAAVALLVWAGTVGSVAGPKLLGWVGRWLDRDSGYSAGYLVALVMMVAATLILFGLLRPDPNTLIILDAESKGGGITDRKRVALAVATLVSAQTSMMVIMSATPLHVDDLGHGLDLVGTILSLHTLGMFAFSPLTGWLTDRVGPVRMIEAGVLVMMLAAWLAGMAPHRAVGRLEAGLFALGLGWNFMFVAGSSLLTSSLAQEGRAKIQGRVDSSVWIASAAGSVLSGVGLAVISFGGLAFVGAALVAIPLAMSAMSRRSLTPA